MFHRGFVGEAVQRSAAADLPEQGTAPEVVAAAGGRHRRIGGELNLAAPRAVGRLRISAAETMQRSEEIPQEMGSDGGRRTVGSE